MGDYHKYVFDAEAGRFIGDFEKMYRAESRENFDSWHQDDTRDLPRRIVLEMLSEHNFERVLDLGCGKGLMTHFLKRRNNRVLGVDISEACLQVARARYPDIEFQRLDLNDLEALNSVFARTRKEAGPIDLVLGLEVLSYTRNWREILKAVWRHGRYLLLTCFVPENPMGFIKTEEELCGEVLERFRLIHWVTVHIRNHVQVILLAESRGRNAT